MKDKPLIKLKNVSKFYYNKGNVASGFSKINIDFFSGEFVVITGESGSGKSTLLNVISGLDSYEEGELYINGNETSHYSPEDFEHYRKTYIGNIFQNFNLIGSYTVYQNIEIVLLLNGFKKKDIKNKVLELIKKVDLYKYRNARVSHLSGGQKQRVAIARALAKDTPIIIADEPTGNLDSKSATSVLELLAKVAKDKLVIIVTHNYNQVEQYATRKIEMSDGKIREDIKLKSYNETDVKIFDYKDIKFFSKLRIGLRNTFNIIPKFFLMFLVFLFVSLSFLSAYSGFKVAQKNSNDYGYNNFFQNTNEKRIVIQKKDKTPFTDEEISSINQINNVVSLEKNDIFLDAYFSMAPDDFSYYAGGRLKNISEITSVDDGKMPENDNEVVIEVNKSTYYFRNGVSDLDNIKFDFYSNSGTLISSNLKVVGIIYSDVSDDQIYVMDSLEDKAKVYINESYSTVKVDFNGIKYDTLVVPLSSLSHGEALVADTENQYCTYSWCKDKNINISVKNIYYADSINLTVKNVYYKSTFESLTGLKNYDEHMGEIYISYEDYNYLYNKATYQISIFTDDYRNVDTIADTLKESNYNVVKLKDAKTQTLANFVQTLKIIKTVVLFGMFIGLFFIAYFVIKLIQKSKNIYYATVRILGGSKKVIKDFIKIELYTIFNIAYLFIIFLIVLVKNNIIKSAYINKMISYLSIKEYILIYAILFIMSYLISIRYARKLFKSSAMKSYREEV